MGKINAEWHNADRMPKNPTWEQRVDWHMRRRQSCACREMSPALNADRLYRKA
jgi:hypothetical protein